MRRHIPKEALEKASETAKKIYSVLDEQIEVDFCMFKDNNVLIRLRLGDRVLAEYPIHCEVVDNEVYIYNYKKE